MSQNEEHGGKHFLVVWDWETHGLREQQARGPQNARTANCEGRKARTVNCADATRECVDKSLGHAVHAVAPHLSRITHSIQPRFELRGPQWAAKAWSFKG